MTLKGILQNHSLSHCLDWYNELSVVQGGMTTMWFPEKMLLQ